MKFHEAHRTDLLKCFSKANLVNNQFSFRKKKGRIIVEHNESKAWFSYFYKDGSHIDLETTERVEKGSWEVKTSFKEVTEVDSWNKVVKLLRIWLNHFKD